MGTLNIHEFRYYGLSANPSVNTDRNVDQSLRVGSFYTEAIRWLRKHEIPAALAPGVGNNVIATSKPIDRATERLLVAYATGKGIQLIIIEQSSREVVETAQQYLVRFPDLEGRMRHVHKN